MRRTLVLCLSALALLASTGAAEPAPAGEQPRAAAAQAKGSTLAVRSSRFGRILVDGRGHALYLFTRDRRNQSSRCYGDCATAWPPFLTTGKPRAGAGTTSRLLGTKRRRDGSMQVTYRGRPLYFYVDDRKPGQILCHDVVEFGGTWLVVAPSGRAIR